jgi:Tol biopolymer transport system component
MSRSRRSCGVTGALLALAIPSVAASFPPHLRFRSVSTARVVVHYHQGLEPMARRAAAVATEVLQAHEARYQVRVGPRVQIVLADASDDPNGFASPLPYPLVQVRAAAPDGADEIGNYDDWLRFILTHELAHIVHLEQARGLPGFGRRLLGRAPFLFPNALTPTWLLEGLATYEETEGTPFGRGRNPDSRMVLRMAALEGGFLKEDRPVLGLDRWPAGQAPYLYGEAFLRDLTQRVGPRTIPDLARAQSGKLIPYADDLTAHGVTGASFHRRWREWSDHLRNVFTTEAEQRRSRGLTATRALTRRGVRQTAPRFSPDGSWIAYTSGALTRLRQIRVVRPDGRDDRSVVERNGGVSLAWTPDGTAIVYDEPEFHRQFASHSDLRIVVVATGRVQRLTQGLRASDPDVSRDGRVVFVRRYADRSELALMDLDGSAPSDLTSSSPGTQWAGPRFNPRGDAVVASRLTPGGWLDVVHVDLGTGAVHALTQDRAKDVEPAWTPDGSSVVFRSDRDGISNLHALRLSDRALLRVTNVLGGAFRPDVSPDGRQVAFARYGAAGYDVHLADLDLSMLPAADPFEDRHPAAAPPVQPLSAPSRPYRPYPTALPRFWSPYLAFPSGETQLGAVTGGADPLLQHAYALDVHWGTETERVGFQGVYQYDRFRPTLLAFVENETALQRGERVGTRRLELRATLPLVRRVRRSMNLSLAWRREREALLDARPREALDLGGLEVAWALGTAREYAYSISPVDGGRLRLAYLKEEPALGSDLSLGKLTADGRAYLRLFGEGDVVALRAGGGTTFGRPSFQRSFAVGGFPGRSLADLVRTNQSVLRGYPDDAFTGRSFVHGNLEYRVPLGHPQRGFRLFPVFVRHLHATVFADAANAWSGRFRLRDVKTSAGLALGAHVYLGHGLPLAGTVGLGRGFAGLGQTQVYFRAGLAF